MKPKQDNHSKIHMRWLKSTLLFVLESTPVRPWLNWSIDVRSYSFARVGNMASRRLLLLRCPWPRTAIASTWFSYLACVLSLLVAGAVYALDPNKRLNQYETKVEL